MAEITKLLETAAKHGLNGAVVSFGLDTLCKKSADYFRRLDEVEAACERNNIELIPADFSARLRRRHPRHDRNLAEGCRWRTRHSSSQTAEARFVPDPASLVNGGFEQFTGNKASKASTSTTSRARSASPTRR